VTDIAFGKSGVDEHPSDKARTIKAVMVEPNEALKTTEVKLSIDTFNKAVSIGTGYDYLVDCK